nr:hypothetical protein [Tanacetum cinerariifolium]
MGNRYAQRLSKTKFRDRLIPIQLPGLPNPNPQMRYYPNSNMYLNLDAQVAFQNDNFNNNSNKPKFLNNNPTNNPINTNNHKKKKTTRPDLDVDQNKGKRQKSALAFLKDKHKWKIPIRKTQDETEDGLPTWNPSSLETNCRVYLASEELQKVKLDRLFRSRPDNVSRNAPTTIRVRPKGKMERLDRETMARVELFNFLKVAEDLKLLQIDTRGMDPVDAAIINAQKTRIQALYEPRN